MANFYTKSSLVLFLSALFIGTEVSAQCPNADFSDGNFSNWVQRRGRSSGNGVVNWNGTNGNFEILTGGTDPLTANGLQHVPPGYTRSARINFANQGYTASEISYTLPVTLQNALFVYNYAVVFGDPGHDVATQPWFSISVTDQNDVLVPCTRYVETIGAGSQGYQNGTGNRRWKNWTRVGLDLSAYVGTNVTIRIAAGHCGQGAGDHYGYAYIVAECQPMEIDVNYCLGAPQAILTAPPGFETYDWQPGGYNGSQLIVNNPASGPSSYTVTMTSNGGQCTSVLTANVVPSSVSANFDTLTTCAQTVNFLDSSSVNNDNIASWNWNFGDGNTSTSPSPSHQYATPGTYTVTLIPTTDNGCTDTITRVVEAYPDPVAAFTYQGQVPSATLSDAFCAPNIVFTGTSSHPAPYNASLSINSWNWDFGNGTSASTTNGTSSYTSDGTHTVTYIVQDNRGCADTVSQQFSTYTPPTADFTVPSLCGLAANFGNISSINSPGATFTNWAWNFGNGNTSAAQNPSHTYAAQGTYNVTLIAQDNRGCFDTIVKPYTNNQYPVALMTLPPECGLTQVFTDNSSDPVNEPLTWNWDFGDGQASSLQNPTNTYAAPGIYNVTLVVEDTVGCRDTVILAYESKDFPNADFVVPQICGINPTFADASSTNWPATSVTSWAWEFGDAQTAAIQNPSNAYAAQGTYNVTLIVGASDGCYDTIVKPYTNNQYPVALMTLPPECGLTQVFTDNSSDPVNEPLTWNWDFGDGQASSLQNPTNTYAAPGIYNVTLVVEDTVGCRDTATLAYESKDFPNADFVVPQICGINPTFADASSTNWPTTTVTSWAWEFGDAQTAAIQNPSNTYAAQGTYNVTLIVGASDGCYDTIVKPYTNNQYPVALMTLPPECGLTQVFTDNSSDPVNEPLTWNWDFGDGQTSSLQNPTSTYATPGIYNVTLVVEDTVGCRDTITLAYESKDFPNADFILPHVCGLTNAFTDASSTNWPTTTVTSWAWEFGDAQTANTQNPSNAYAAQGTYNVTLIVGASDGCYDTIVKPYTNSEYPIAEIFLPTECGLTQTFTDASVDPEGRPLTWSWYFGEGTPSSQQHPLFTHSREDLWEITLIVTDEMGCRDTMIVPYQSKDIPTADFNANNVCFGENTSFTDMSNPQTSSLGGWSWHFGDLQTGYQANPTNRYNAPGEYQTTLVVTSQFDCADTITKPVTVYFPPVVNFLPLPACEQTLTSITNASTIGGQSSITSYVWDFGTPSIPASTAINPQVTYNIPGTYTITATATSNHGCVDTASRQITVWPRPIIDFTAAPTQGCYPYPVNFTSTSSISSGTISSYAWSLGDGYSASAPSFTHTYGTNGFAHYTVTLTATSDRGCSSSLTRNDFITVWPKPEADFFHTPHYPTIADPTVHFQNHSIGADEYIWFLPDGSVHSAFEPDYSRFKDTGTYMVTLVAISEHGCRDTIIKPIVVTPGFTIYIPNVFTPNNNGLNDNFKIHGNGFEECVMRIYDRWGELIAYLNGPDAIYVGWDGTNRGKVVKQDLYAYTVDIVDVTGKPHTYRGHVTVLR